VLHCITPLNIETLLSINADAHVDVTDGDDETALPGHIASRLGFTEVIRVLLSPSVKFDDVFSRIFDFIDSSM